MYGLVLVIKSWTYDFYVSFPNLSRKISIGKVHAILYNEQVPTSKIKDALKAYHKLVSPLKPWKCEIKKNLDFLNDLLVLVTVKQNVDTNLNTLIDLPNEDVCGATTSNLSKSKGARLTNNDE